MYSFTGRISNPSGLQWKNLGKVDGLYIVLLIFHDKYIASPVFNELLHPMYANDSGLALIVLFGPVKPVNTFKMAVELNYKFLVLLQIIIRLNTLLDVIRVPKIRTSGE